MTMATMKSATPKYTGKRKLQSCQDEDKIRSPRENSPCKRRRMDTTESPNSSPTKSPFVTDSDECPTFRTKSFYRSKGNSKHATMTQSSKENKPSPQKTLTPRRISSRILSLKTSESESEPIRTASPIYKNNFRNGCLKSMTSSDSDSETNLVKVLRSRSNLRASREKEYDFPSVMPIQSFKPLSKAEELDVSTNICVKPKQSKSYKTVTCTQPLKKISEKKFFSSKCSSSGPKSFGSVIVRKGFDLKFVPRRMSNEYSNQKPKNKKPPKLSEKFKKLNQKERKTIARNSKVSRSPAAASIVTGRDILQVSKVPEVSLVQEQDRLTDINCARKTQSTGNRETDINVSQDSAIIVNLSGESLNSSHRFERWLQEKSPKKQEQSLPGSQELFSDAMSDTSEASLASGPCDRKLRSGITYSPSRNMYPACKESPARRILPTDCSVNSPTRSGLRSQSPLPKAITPRQDQNIGSNGSVLKTLRSTAGDLDSPGKTSRLCNLSFLAQKQLWQDDKPSNHVPANLPNDGTPTKNKTLPVPVFSIFKTPDQRKSLRNLVRNTSPSISSISPSSTPGRSPKLKKMLKDKDSKNAEQLILDAGQKKFGATVCDVCGMVYTHADPLDETTHAKFHISLINTLKFPGWKKERIVQEYRQEGSRVIMVLSDDPNYATKKVADINKIMGQELGFPEQIMSFHSKYKAFLYISENKTVEGCCIAESIHEGYRIIAEHEGASPPVNDGHQQRPWYCETVPEKADIGISKIWVYKLARQKGIGSRLLDSIRSCFHYGGVIDKNQIAFSDPTPDGKKFATKYTGSPSFLVYKYTR